MKKTNMFSSGIADTLINQDQERAKDQYGFRLDTIQDRYGESMMNVD